MPDTLILAATVCSALAALLAGLALIAARRQTAGLGRAEAMELLRGEGDAIRAASDAGARALRQEIGVLLAESQRTSMTTVGQLSDSLLKQVDTFGARLEAANKTTEARIDGIGQKLNADIERMDRTSAANRDALRALVEEKLTQSAAAHTEASREMREELNASFQRMRQGVGETLNQMGDRQKERLEATQTALSTLAEKHVQTGEQLRQTVEGRLDLLRQENAAELEKVRTTVDEKLNATLNKRLDESFGRVVEQLNKAYEAFGEMRNISAHVGDLKNALTNPKLRGNFGEVQLERLLQDFLTPAQYVKDAAVRENTQERVEFAVRLPGPDSDELLLPVDAKFPREDHDRMIQALEAGNVDLAEQCRKQLEARIKSFAKDIAKKYINPPHTTEHAILFLPTESLFAEVMRQPGLFEHLYRDCHVLVAGPTTFAAILHGFQMNYRSLALAQQSGEVWKVLSAVRTEFGKYNEVVNKVGRQLETAAKSVAAISTRARAVNRTLKDVEHMPDEAEATRLLGLDEALGIDDADDESDGPALVLPAARTA